MKARTNQNNLFTKTVNQEYTDLYRRMKKTRAITEDNMINTIIESKVLTYKKRF